MHSPRKGRGALTNPECRYQAQQHEAFDDGWTAEDPSPPPLATTVRVDHTRTIIARNQSPDVPFEQSINPYRGCEHGCVYCFARPTHAYLGLSPGLDFETRLLAKPNAAALLKKELSKPSYRCQPIALGTNTDPYQPVEREWRITRSVLQVLRDYHHPVTVVTKSSLVERDMDILAPMAKAKLAQVMISITSLDHGLARRMEPRASAPTRRVETIRRLSDAGIPTGVLVAPIIPVLTDPELDQILAACAKVGAVRAGYVLLRLPLEVRDLFQEWLHAHYPLKAEHVMQRVRETRGGKDYNPQFGTRMTGQGEYAQLIQRRFVLACKRLGLNQVSLALNTQAFQPPRAQPAQLALL